MIFICLLTDTFENCPSFVIFVCFGGMTDVKVEAWYDTAIHSKRYTDSNTKLICLEGVEFVVIVNLFTYFSVQTHDT